MNRRECNQLEVIQQRMYGFSAMIGTALDALEYQNSRQDDRETAHIELALRGLHYDLASLSETLRELINAGGEV